MLRATVAFAREVGARVVAEGVERPEELAVLRDAEVDFGQGWLFGRPAEAWPADPQASAAPLHVSSSGGGRLERALASAPTVRDASAVVVEHLARTGLMPSVYLEQGGRLRCQAVARLLAGLRRDAVVRRCDRPHLPHRHRHRGVATSPSTPSSSSPSRRSSPSSACR